MLRFSAGGHRWPRPLDGTSGLHRRQEHPQRQQGGGRQVRRHQHERQLLQEQVEVLEVLAAALQRQALPWSLPLPRPLQDLLADGPRNGAAQVREGKGGHEEAPDLRGCPAPIRQEEEDGHPVSTQSSPPQARTKSESIYMFLNSTTRETQAADVGQCNGVITKSTCDQA